MTRAVGGHGKHVGIVNPRIASPKCSFLMPKACCQVPIMASSTAMAPGSYAKLPLEDHCGFSSEHELEVR